MSLLPHCPSCQGFNPPQQARCLHCDASLSAPLTAPKSVSALLALGALGLIGCEMSTSQVYGGPPSYYEDEDRDEVSAQDDCDDLDPEVGVANFGERCEETYPQLVSAEAGAEAGAEVGGAQAGDETSSGGAPSEG